MKKTMSLKQIAANQRNAQHSTGPKTVNGKTVSKMNALKHGILSTQVLVRGQAFDLLSVARDNVARFEVK